MKSRDQDDYRSSQSAPLRPSLLWAASLLVIGGLASPTAASNASGGATETQPSPERQNPEIIVIAPPLFRDLRPERTLDDEAVSSYGVSTIDELILELQSELDDGEEPVFIVNGERVLSLDDFGAYPVEVIRQLQVLPRGSAARVGGSPTQRVFNLSLHRKMRSATVTAAPRVAAEGGWHATRHEAILTTVSGRKRGNVALRVRDEGALLESRRGILQPESRAPYAIGGNVIAYPDLSGEIDPLLSESAGTVVTVAPVPPSSNPALADFAAGANQENHTDVGDFRTLRPALTTYDLNATYTAPLASWLNSTAALRLGRSRSRSLLGLPAGLLVLGADNDFSPFSNDVALAVFGEEPLRSRYTRDFGEANVTLNANLGGSWRAVVSARHSRVREANRSERTASFDPVRLPSDTNPFAAVAPDLVSVLPATARSRYRTTQIQASVTGSPLKLPAGNVTTTLDGRLGWNAIDSQSSFSDQERKLRRTEHGLRSIVDIPLTSRRNNFHPQLGELTASAEYGLSQLSDAGTASRSILGLTWEPDEAIRLRGSIEHSKEPPSVELLGAAVVETPGVRVFDLLTGDTVEVLYVSGGNPELKPQVTDTRRLSAILRLSKSLGLQLNGEYTHLRARNFVSSLPPASVAVMQAFPDRFLRDDDGVLTTVDARPVNFERLEQRRLRYGLSLSAPVGSAARKPATRAQLTVNHNLLFKDEILIRPGLEPVDLLGGGAIGIAGGRLRHQVDGTAALTSGGSGVRMGFSWRGPSTLETRIGGATDTLRFSPVLLLNARAFADAGRFFPDSSLAKGLRLSLDVINIANDRQDVRDSFGNTPLQYQPAYRDPLGRTIEFEIRKVF